MTTILLLSIASLAVGAAAVLLVMRSARLREQRQFDRYRDHPCG